MQKFNKLSQDTRPQEQPGGTYPFGKNGIQNFKQGSVFNEKGFLKSAAVIPYVTCGIIECDKFPIFFSTDNVNSAIGYFDTINDVYIPVVNDISLPYKLNFSTNFYITGEAQRNYKGEVVVAFTDKNGIPMYVNMDNPDLFSLNSFRLFPNAVPPDIDTEVLSGGILQPGAYYIAVKPVKNDGTEVGYIAVSSPKIVDGTQGTVTDKAIQIKLTNIDPNYENVQIAVISKINGVLSAVQTITPISAIGSVTILFTGTELTESVTLDEVLASRQVYERVGTMGQLNDSLYIGNLVSPKPLKMQKWANLVRIKWHSKLITVDPVYEPMKTGAEKSFMHQEVYAMYIRYKLNTGGVTNSFTIPGTELVSGDLATSSIATAEGLTAKVFQVEDTIPSFDFPSKSGYMGKWQNETELYPNTIDFDSTSVGGQDLRNQPIRHHRFPSIAWCKQNLYAGEVNYGRNSLDMLGISVENVIIPAEYVDQVVGWEIFYAKRNVANSTVIGQSLLMFGASNKLESNLNPSNYYSTGGNFGAYIFYKSSEIWDLNLAQAVVHFHSFDMLFNKPSVLPQYIAPQLKLRRLNIAATGGYIEDQAINSANDGPIVFCLDYIQNGASPTVADKRLKAVKETQYVPNNIKLGKWQNNGIEGFFGARMSNPEKLIPDGEVTSLAVQPGSRSSYTPPSDTPQSETTFLSNMMSIRKELFSPFTSQAIVRAAQSNIINNSTIFYNGDTYICDYSFHTYGLWSSTQEQNENSFGSMFMGTKVVRRFLCECAANLYARYEDTAQIYSKYYPKSPLVPNDASNYLTNFIRSYDPNQFGYKKDSNALDDLFTSNIFNTFVESITSHPYRIHRLGKLSRQSKLRSWRTALPLDYYEAQKNMGQIIHIEGMDDRLIIHHENAMFLTQDKAKLDTDIIAITLGSGDIFQFAPQEGISAPLGYGGTLHDLACVRTPNGYVFIESKEGNIYIYKGGLELLNDTLNTFFKEFLRITETNIFQGNGYTIGYDPYYKRLLLTVKNKQLISGGAVIVYSDSIINSLQIGDIVLKDGILQQFLGENSTEYNCDSEPASSVSNFETTIPENTPIGNLIGTLTATNINNFYIAGSSAPFILDASTGKIYLTGPLDYYVRNSYVFNAVAHALDGTDLSFTITIHITVVNRAPIANDAEVTIPDNSVHNAAVVSVIASDREGNPLTYSILSGNIDNVFQINSSTGVITVDDQTKLNGIGIPRYVLIIQVSDGSLSVTCTIIVNILHINKPPTATDTTFNITDALASGASLGIATAAIDPENDALTYTLVSESVPGAFTFNPTTLEVKLVNNSSLNPAVTPTYVINISVTDGLPGHSLVYFNIYINVVYDRNSIEFAPADPTCLGGGYQCSEGYVLSPDSSICVKTTQIPATVTGGGCLAESTNSNYGQYFARIYNPGWNNASIGMYTALGGDVYAEMATLFWQNVPNNIGVWVDTDCDGTKDTLASGVKTTASFNYSNTGAARTVYVGVFGDNEFQLKVNESLIADSFAAGGDPTIPFKVLHIFPVDIINGSNIFNIVGTGDGSTNDSLGMIVMDNTASQIQAATSYGGLVNLFSTNSLIGQPNSIATCPTGYILDYVLGSPVCKLIETEAPTVGTGHTITWANVEVKDLRHGSSVITTKVNQSTPVLYFQDIRVPYYPDVSNHIDCGGENSTYLSVKKAKNAQKNDCTTGIGTVVNFTVPEGSWMSAVSQSDADNQAQTEADSTAQSYANSNGSCS